MVISNTNTKSIYNCNGTTRNFNLGFVFDENVSNVGISVKHADGTTEQIEENYEIVEGVLTYPTVESKLDPLPEGDKIIIERFTPLTQTINLTQQGPLDAETLEGGYDKNTLISQELQEQINRAIKFPVADDGETDAQEYINDLQDLVTEATTQAGIATTKAGEAATSATAADTAKTTAQKWAEGTDAQVEELGGTRSAKGWANYTEDVIENSGIDQIVDVIDDIQTVAGISSDVSQVAGISSAVSTVSAHDSDVTLVSDNMASVMTTASNIGNVNTVAGISADVSTVADNNSNVTAVAGNSTNINAVAGNEANINAVNANKTNIDAVAGNNTNVTTVATNISNVNTAATNMSAIIAAPTAAQNAATSATNAQTWAEGTDTAVTALGGEHSSKGWAGRAQQIVESLGAIYKPTGSITFASLPALSADVLGNVYNITDAFTTTAGFVEGAGNNYPAGTNVAVVDVGTGGSHSYKFDVLSGVVDLSAYRTAAQQDVIDATKQDNLVSGTNIKTVNGNSLLGSGNVDIDALPSQTGQSGKFLTTDGTDASWADVAVIVETYNNGSSWYRVYSDGWCEQGGLIERPASNHLATITLLKAYKDTNWEYADSMLLYSQTGKAWWVDHEASAITAKTTNSFSRYVGNGASYSWQARGYIS